MKKLLIATLFAVFTLSANAQTEEVVENKSEITTTIHLNFETSINKIEDVFSVKKLLYNIRKNRETNKFKLTASSIALDYNKEHLEYYEIAKRLMSKEN